MLLHESIRMPESEQEQIQELHRLLQHGLPELVGPDGIERMPLPQSVYEFLKDVVRSMQQGRSMVLVRDDEELTTQTAANLLGVSRPHLIKVLEKGEIPFYKAGSHRRILLKDLMAYTRKRNAERRKILDELAKRAFEDGFYDNASMPADGEDE